MRHFGATGNGTTLDTPAINKAIEAVAAAGGGTVLVPAGGPGYDPSEPGPGNYYEDFGHRHCHNALIWGAVSKTYRSSARG